MTSALVSSSFTSTLGLSIASALVLAFAACGGSVNTGDPSTGLGDNSGRNDAGTSSGSAVSGACPASAPLPGAACDSAGLSCEYGGEGDYLACSTIATCGADKTWTSNGSGAECTALPSQNEAACPSSYDALAPSSACPAVHGACVYPEGKCACASCFSQEAGGPDKGWSCVRWPTPTGCPTPRPRIGSACAVDGQQCSYETRCNAVSTDLPTIACANGLWQERNLPPAPCPFPMCSR